MGMKVTIVSSLSYTIGNMAVGTVADGSFLSPKFTRFIETFLLLLVCLCILD